MPATDDAALAAALAAAVSESPWHRFTVVFLSRDLPDHVLGTEWIELQRYQMEDPAWLRDELRSQCERRGPGMARAKAVLLEGNYHPSQACMALAANVEIRATSG